MILCLIIKVDSLKLKSNLKKRKYQIESDKTTNIKNKIFVQYFHTV